MNIGEVIISIALILGLGYILFIVLQDPILMLKSAIRSMQSGYNLRLTVLLSPIWIPVWIIDRIFNLKIFIKKFEDASLKQTINFGQFVKYIQIDTNDIKIINKVVNSFIESRLYENPDYDFHELILNYSIKGEEIIIKADKGINQSKFYELVEYLSYASPKNRIFHIKAIFINCNNRADSYFLFAEPYYRHKLIGKTFKNKKIYVEINSNEESIYYNSNIDYFKNFKFNNFINDISRLKYKELVISPAHNTLV
jgi:hypothetical protein